MAPWFAFPKPHPNPTLQDLVSRWLRSIRSFPRSTTQSQSRRPEALETPEGPGQSPPFNVRAYGREGGALDSDYATETTISAQKIVFQTKRAKVRVRGKEADGFILTRKWSVITKRANCRRRGCWNARQADAGTLGDERRGERFFVGGGLGLITERGRIPGGSGERSGGARVAVAGFVVSVSVSGRKESVRKRRSKLVVAPMGFRTHMEPTEVKQDEDALVPGHEEEEEGFVGNMRGRARRVYRAWVTRNQRVLNLEDDVVDMEADEDEDEDVSVVPESVESVAAEVLVAVRKLYGDVVRDDGKAVDYTGLKSSPYFQQYTEVARKLRRVDPSGLAESNRKAFFLNVYNALLLHAFAVMGRPQSLMERMNLYSHACYEIGGLVYCLDDIEHGVLRRNRPSPAPLAQKPFDRSDPRLRNAMGSVDARIHMALNCGAVSCPALFPYDGRNLDAQLDAAAASYCESEVHPSVLRPEVELSMIFRWYQPDFGDGSTLSVLLWVIPRLSPEKSRLLQDMILASERFGTDIAVKYRTYDWTLNDQGMQTQ